MADALLRGGDASSLFRWRSPSRAFNVTRSGSATLEIQSGTNLAAIEPDMMEGSAADSEADGAVIALSTAATIWIEGQRFIVEPEGDVIYIRHPRWSLVGFGDSLAAAERNMRDEAAAVAKVWFDMSPASMDHEALKLRDFLVKLVGSGA